MRRSSRWCMSPPDRPEGTPEGEAHPEAGRRRPQSVRLTRHNPGGESLPATSPEVAGDAPPRATEDANGPATGSPPRATEVPFVSGTAHDRGGRAPSVIRVSRTVDVDLEKEARARREQSSGRILGWLYQ